jgi:hypothetical protein
MRPLLRQPRIVTVGVWLVAFAVSAVTLGLPTKRSSVLVWIALAVFALGADRLRSTLRSFATTWLPLFGALAAYDLLRGVSDDADQSQAHSRPQLDLYLWIGAGHTPTERLQHALWTPGQVHWWDYAAWGVYQSHFLVPLLVAVVLWGVRHRLATPYIVALAALSWLALATYALYPAQPPWMTARDGMTGDVDRIVRQVWREVGIDRAARVFTTERADGSNYSNPVAALPSLHAAFPMLIAATLWGTRRWLDVVLAAYVLAMGTALVYAGEHFTFDILLGWAYALLIAAGVRVYQSRASSTARPTSPPHAAFDGDLGTGVAPEPALRSRYTSLPQTDETRS